MFNKFMIAAAIASAALASPALAQSFSGPRVEVSAGVDDVTKARDTSDVNYGAALGIDAPIASSNFRIGVELTADQVFERDRDLGVSGRLGYVFSDRVLVYGKAGYANYRNINFKSRATTLDGLRVGGGVEFALTKNLYAGAEYRYTDFDQGVGKHGGLVKVGVRF